MTKRKNKKVTANRNYKDTVFRKLFSDRRNLLSLYMQSMGQRIQMKRSWRLLHWKMQSIWE